MKKLAFGLIIAAMATLSCSSSEGKTETNNSAEVSESQSTGTENSSEGKTIKLTKALFLEQVMDYESNPTEWVYKGEKPGLVDFYADWCGPCKITSPIMEELAVEYAGKINIYKVNVDQERELAGIFGVQSIPTFLYMPMDGKPSITSGIARSKEETKEMFKQQIEQILLENGSEL